jgi:hypothetical protein
MSNARGVLRINSRLSDKPGGGCLPVYRTTYTLAQRKALNALAESNPTPEEYRQERARILSENPEGSHAKRPP